MNKKTIFLTVILFLLCASLYAFGNKEKPAPPNIVQVTGTVRLTGTALFSEIVITNEEGSWYIAADEAEKLHSLQHRTVTVEGEETVIELTFASGIPAGIRRKLSNVVIIQEYY